MRADCFLCVANDCSLKRANQGTRTELSGLGVLGNTFLIQLDREFHQNRMKQENNGGHAKVSGCGNCN